MFSGEVGGKRRERSLFPDGAVDGIVASAAALAGIAHVVVTDHPVYPVRGKADNGDHRDEYDKSGGIHSVHRLNGPLPPEEPKRVLRQHDVDGYDDEQCQPK